MMCMWLSIKPGITRRLFASTTRVAGPASFMTRSSSPTATNRPPPNATAAACGFRGSSVEMRALRRISSALPSMSISRSWSAQRLPTVSTVRALGSSPKMCSPHSDFTAVTVIALAGDDAPGQRRNLLADQDAEQSEQGNHRRRRRAHVQKAVDRADEQADGERHEIHLHMRLRCCLLLRDFLRFAIAFHDG